MTKSNNNQITDILNTIYNLIVNPETTENERELLVTYKNEIEVGKKDNDLSKISNLPFEYWEYIEPFERLVACLYEGDGEE